tara:strand:+ start:2643 stop:3302 length:660 start_codon:yes stop_codon:yes gene_type:complete
MINKISVIDYGMGNLFNVIRALESLDSTVEVIKTPDEVMKADRLLLPGVGAFKDGMDGLIKNKLDDGIKEYSQTGKPLLGICLGMQLLMTSSSENGSHSGLDLVKGQCTRFAKPTGDNKKFKIPQIGWNQLFFKNIKQRNKTDWTSSILNGADEPTYMYFLHSYFVEPKNKKVIFAETSYGNNHFCSVLQKDNIYGCQFHPERSGKQGLIILKNFLEFN